jgi:hypothetical protein
MAESTPRGSVAGRVARFRCHPCIVNQGRRFLCRDDANHKQSVAPLGAGDDSIQHTQGVAALCPGLLSIAPVGLRGRTRETWPGIPASVRSMTGRVAGVRLPSFGSACQCRPSATCPPEGASPRTLTPRLGAPAGRHQPPQPQSSLCCHAGGRLGF